ncbi:hypothetical protein H2200_005720 [Cladophialophora chaetospira]|uniref:Glucose-methanol-choline oxidoreductase N-terminal domain-containing protein n=1 Tax=Cladophialophora chaetospira TaxID=386627 RepID=A0AA38XA66_9EURO|nr:hypothetical protein H2200_005720 [Cladophialophora chaetospira]
MRTLLLGAFGILSSNALQFYTSPQSLPRTAYDFVVIGGGAGGSTVAARLSQRPNVTVLLVEAGGSPEGILATEIPYLGVALQGSALDWNYTTTNQTGLLGRSMAYERGKVLGGSTILNLMTWNRGSDDTWDDIARKSTADDWAWPAIDPFYRQTSHLVPPADGRDVTGKEIPEAHGTGPVQVSVPGFPTEIDDKVLNASLTLGSPFEFNPDLNDGRTVGTGLLQSSIGGGERSSAYSAYLRPALNAQRPNLYVLVNTQATKLIQTGSNSVTPVFRAALLSQGPNSTTYRVNATKEIILSAGVIGTPALLQLSGIGGGNFLRSLQIEPLVELSDVGRGMQDHPLVPMYFHVNSNQTFDHVFGNVSVLAALEAQWNASHTGILTNSPGNTQGFMRIPANSSIFEKFGDPSSGTNAAHLELIFVYSFAPLGAIPPQMGSFLSVLAIVVSPLSRGSVHLKTTNPFDSPLINPNYLGHDFDAAAVIVAMRNAFKLVASSDFDGLIGDPLENFITANSSDDDLLTYARNVSGTVNHGCCTCSMSPNNAIWGVVNPDLRLKKVDGVRVVDASVFHKIPECHIQALVYTLAEKAVDFIDKQYFPA